MSKIRPRAVAALLLLAIGLAAGSFGLTALKTRQRFLDAENVFRTDSSVSVPEGDWVVRDATGMQARAIEALGLAQLLTIRDAYAAYREVVRLRAKPGFTMPEIQAAMREVTRFYLERLVRTSSDPAVIAQAATLLGDLHAQDVVWYVQLRNGERAAKAYERAVEAYTRAITDDNTEMLNQEAKEHLETLIRMFMGEAEPQAGPGPDPGGRPGASDPGSGY